MKHIICKLLIPTCMSAFGKLVHVAGIGIEEVSLLLYFFDQTPWLLFFALLVFVGLLIEGGYYSILPQGWCLFPWKARWYQQWLDKARKSKTVRLLDTVSSSSAVSCGNEPYNMSSPSASLITITRNHVRVRLPRILTVATIRERRLYEEIQYISC